MERIYIALAALFGGFIAALLGWLESGETFNIRKFGGSMIRTVLASVILALSVDSTGQVNIASIFYAFLGGAGVDVIGNRLAGNFGNGSFPLAESPGKDDPEG